MMHIHVLDDELDALELDAEMQQLSAAEPALPGSGAEILMHDPRPPSGERGAGAGDAGAMRQHNAAQPLGLAPWRNGALPMEEKAKLFIKAVALAHGAGEKVHVFVNDQTKADTLDHIECRNLAERIWDYDIAKLHEQAVQVGADPCEHKAVSTTASCPEIFLRG